MNVFDVSSAVNCKRRMVWLLLLTAAWVAAQSGGVDALGLYEGGHFIGGGIGADHRAKSDVPVFRQQLAGIPCGIEGIASKAAPIEAIACVRELDHTFAKGEEAAHKRPRAARFRIKAPVPKVHSGASVDRRTVFSKAPKWGSAMVT